MTAIATPPAYIFKSNSVAEYRFAPAFVNLVSFLAQEESDFSLRPIGENDGSLQVGADAFAVIETQRAYCESSPLISSVPSSELSLAVISKKLATKRNSEDAEWFAFNELKPLVQLHGSILLNRIDAMVMSGEIGPITRHYFAYMLSYLDGSLREYSMDLLLKYSVLDDEWLKSGAEEGLERLGLA